jgi:Uma2 family endonuclease
MDANMVGVALLSRSPAMKTLAIPTETALVVKGPQQGRWTVAEWERLGDPGKRYEIIAGVLYFSDVPSVFHQWIVGELVRLISLPAEDAGLAYAIQGPVGVQLSDQDVVQPDFAIVRSENVRIIRDRWIWGAPDVMLEVLSLGSEKYDLHIKLEAYERAGVPEYAIVDPRDRVLQHFRLDRAGRYTAAQAVGETEQFAFDCLPSIRFTVGDLFAGSPDTTL